MYEDYPTTEINIEFLCLESGFYSKEVFSFLQYEGIPHIVLVKKHSIEMKTLLNGKKARFAQYMIKGKGILLKWIF